MDTPQDAPVSKSMVMGHQQRRGGTGRRPGRRQRQGDVVPDLAGALLDGGAADELQLGGLGLAAHGQPGVVEGRPGGARHLVADRHVGLQRRLGRQRHLHLGAALLARRQRGELALQVLDLAVDLADLDLGIEDRPLRLGRALADQLEQLAPVGLRCGAAVGGRWRAGQLGQVLDQLLLRLGGLDRRLQRRISRPSASRWPPPRAGARWRPPRCRRAAPRPCACPPSRSPARPWPCPPRGSRRRRPPPGGRGTGACARPSPA